MRKIILIICLIFIGLIFRPTFVYTEQPALNKAEGSRSVAQEAGGNSTEIDALNQKIAEKKAKIAQLEATMAEYKKQITQKQLEGKTLSNTLSILNNRILQVETDIKTTEEKMSSLQLEIEALQLSIGDKEKVIAKQKVMLAELVRSIYYNNDKNYLEIASTYQTFSDFYNRLQYLQSIDAEIGKSVRSLRLAKEDLADKKQQTVDRRKSYEDLKTELSQKKKNLTDQSTVKTNLLIQTKSSENKFQTLLSSLKGQYQQLEAEELAIEKEMRRKLEALNKLDKIEDSAAQLSWPVPSHYLTTYFHDPEYPYRYVFEHNAVDIRAGQGTPVKAAASGYIGQAKKCSSSSCYSYVMIIHNDGLATVYGHLSVITVAVDRFVVRGDIIGYSGGTPGTVGAGPFVTGPHLHFEVRRDGIPVNPMNYLAQ